MIQDHSSVILNQDVDSEDNPGIAQPLSAAEIDDLIYSDALPVAERLEQLRALRDELLERRSGDLGGEREADDLFRQVDGAIRRLEADDSDMDETGGYDNALPGSFDPAERHDLLSPDDDLLLGLDGDGEDLEEEDMLDSTEWDEGDDFRPEHGVH